MSKTSQKVYSEDSVIGILGSFWHQYKTKTQTNLKIMDAFILYCTLIMIVQLGYYIIVGDFPRNSLLSGLFAPIGSMAITICFRKQINPDTKYMQISDERAFWEYLIAMFVLYLTVVNFIG